MSDILSRIADYKRIDVAERKTKTSVSKLLMIFSQARLSGFYSLIRLEEWVSP